MDVTPEQKTLPDGSQYWCLHGKLHRTEGSAYIGEDGRQEWYLNGVDMTSEINAWMETKGITWPWDAETQMEFVITWL
jgi:hypothetical protein